MRPTDLADLNWLTATVRRHSRRLGLRYPPARVDLLDVRIRNPHRPESTRCSGWATVRVRDNQVFLLRSDGDPGSGGTILPGLPLRVWRFPDDPGLPALAAVTEPVRARALLPRRMAADHRVADVRVVRWQPGVSATVRCLVEGPDGRRVLYAKLLASDDAASVDAIQRRLHDEPRDGLRVAEPLGADRDHGILWTREVAGRPLLAALGSGDPELVDRTATQCGRALAALHTSAVVPPRTVEPAGVVAEAAKKARKISAARPEHEAAVRRLAAVAGSVSGPGERGPLHGDFHVEQILLSADGPVLLDLDEMATGDPAADLAELAVDLGGRRLPTATTGQFLQAFADSYERSRGTLPARTVLVGYAAAELLNRCYRHLRRPVPGWADALAADVRGADAVLATVERMTSGVRR